MCIRTLSHVHHRRCNKQKLSKGWVPHAFQAQSYKEASDPTSSGLLHSKSRFNSTATVEGKRTGQTGLGDKGQSSSTIKKMFGLLFGKCCSHHAIETGLRGERKAQKKRQKDMKEVKEALYPNNTRSHPGSKERESNTPTPFEQCYANYENFDPSHPSAPYVSTSQMVFDSQLGGNFGQHGHPFDAPPPLLQSYRDLAWPIKSLLIHLVILFLVWLVALTPLFILVHRYL
jgi:hypothetical protein